MKNKKVIIALTLIISIVCITISNVDSSATNASALEVLDYSEINNEEPVTTEYSYVDDQAKAKELGIVIGNGVKISEVYDGVHDIIATEEDFETEEAFREYLKAKGLTYKESDFDRELSEMGLFGAEETDEQYRDVPTITATPIYKADFSGSNGLINENAIQSYVIDGNYIYIAQHYGKWYFNNSNNVLTQKTGNYVLLSKCAIDYTDNSFSRVNAMLLEDVGHGQTLEKYTYNGNNYFLISCGLYQSGQNQWSIQLGRISYSGHTIEQLKDESNVVNNADIKRLIDLSYSNSTGDYFGAMRRMDAAIVYENNNSYLLIWKRCETSPGVKENQFSVYNFDTVNYILSSSPGNVVSFWGNPSLRNACDIVFNNPNKLPVSVQGVEISQRSTNNKHNIYLASGDEQSNNNTGKNLIFRYEASVGSSIGTYKKRVIIDDTGVWNLYGSQYYNSNLIAEIESVKISGNYLRFVLVDTASDAQRQVLSQIAISDLS